MILPTTYFAALLLMLVSMLCWGSWANTFKLTKNWRFELFYFDYSIGVFLVSLIAAFTFGSMGNELTFSDNLLIAGKRQMAYALAAGVIFNLANMLLVAAISVAGMSVAFPIGIGLALVIGVIWNYALKSYGNPVLLFSGVALVVLAILVDATAYRLHAREKAAAAPVPAPDGRRKAGTKRASAAKGIVLSLISGVLMGSFYPLVEMSKVSDIGLGPYSVAFIFSIGIVGSTFIFNLYFMNLPVQGEPVELMQYFRGSFKTHLLGLLGGILWGTGAITNFAAASAPPEVNVGPAISYALGQGATLVSALWGLLVWKEFAGASGSVKRYLGLMLVLFAAGLGLVAVAPLWGK